MSKGQCKGLTVIHRKNADPGGPYLTGVNIQSRTSCSIYTASNTKVAVQVAFFNDFHLILMLYRIVRLFDNMCILAITNEFWCV